MAAVQAKMTGAELRKWMLAHGFEERGEPAGARLARELDVDRSTVAKWLRDERPIDYRTVLALEALAAQKDDRAN